VKKLFSLYNEQGLTSIGDRNAGRDSLDLYLSLHNANELTVRLNVARSFNSSGSREEIARRFDSLPGKDGRGGPTGTGDDWVRIGPIKLFLDGGMLNGSAFMRKPWPRGETYQIERDDYRGLLFIQPEQLRAICEEGAKRKWAITAHCAGEGGMDVLLDAYEFTNRSTPIRDLRFCITHANFPSAFNLERCQKLGVCADVQPAWLYKDANTLLKVLGPERMRWFQPYRSWMKYTTIGGGSDHMLRYDPVGKYQPLEPVARHLGSGDAQARTGRRPRTERATFARAGTASLHDQQCLSQPRGESERHTGSRQARRPDRDRSRRADLPRRRHSEDESPLHDRRRYGRL
jgi:predicted amidohydrolase YtcJ